MKETSTKIAQAQQRSTTQIQSVKQKQQKARDRQLQAYRKQAEEVQKQQMQLMEKISMTRVGVAESPRTEQDQIYIEQRRQDAEYYSEQRAMRKIELEAEARVAQAKKDKRLREENKQRRQAVEERIQKSVEELQAVKTTIEKTKQEAELRRRAAESARADQTERVKAEASEFRDLMTKTFAQREKARQAEFEARVQYTYGFWLLRFWVGALLKVHIVQCESRNRNRSIP